MPANRHGPILRMDSSLGLPSLERQDPGQSHSFTEALIDNTFGGECLVAELVSSIDEIQIEIAVALFVTPFFKLRALRYVVPKLLFGTPDDLISLDTHFYGLRLTKNLPYLVLALTHRNRIGWRTVRASAEQQNRNEYSHRLQPSVGLLGDFILAEGVLILLHEITE